MLVLVHEFGHFFSAKKFGIRVDEFGFGFPPKLFGIKKGETEYTFNLLPFGGFVKIFGETPDEESISGPDASRSFINKPAWKQAIVLFTGVFANFLLAWIIFSFSFMSGLPTSVGEEANGYELKDVHTVVVSVLPKSPADVAGLKTGDKIVSLKSGNQFTTFISPETIKSFATNSKKDPAHNASGIADAGGGLEIGYVRGKITEPINIVNIKPKSSESGELMIGISMDQIGIEKLPFYMAFWEGLKLDWSVTKDTVSGLFGLIKGAIMGKGSFSSVTGPVGMVGVVGDAYKFGFNYLLSFAGLISVNLAIINLLPFPALDGGRLLFLLIEKIKGSKMNPKVTNIANMAGFAVLIILMLFVTYHDVVKLL